MTGRDAGGGGEPPGARTRGAAGKMSVWHRLAPAIGLTLLATAAALVWHLSGREGWGATHRLALAGGALLTYAWLGFAMEPLDEDPGMVDLIGNGVFATGAVVLLAVAIRTVRHTHEQHEHGGLTDGA